MRKSARTQIPPFFDNDPYRPLTHLDMNKQLPPIHLLHSIRLILCHEEEGPVSYK